MRTLSILGALMLSWQLIACSSDQQSIAKDVNAGEFYDLLNSKGGFILDVRTNEELAGGYIPGSLNIDFYSGDFDSQIEKIDKNQAVFVYCAAGGRSGKTMQKMKDLGFKEVYNLSGGFGSYEAAGYEVAKPK